MATQPQGLFGMGGMSPDQMQAQIRQQQMMERAKMTTDERAYLSGGNAGAAVGDGIRSLAGAPKTYDPTVTAAMGEEEILKTVDVTDPQSLLKAVQLAQSKQNYKLANSLMGKFQAAMVAKQEAEKKAADEEKTVQETANLKREGEAKQNQEADRNFRYQMRMETGVSEAEARARASNPAAFAASIASKDVKVSNEFAQAAGGFGFKGNVYSDFTKEQILATTQKLHANDLELKKAGGANLGGLTAQIANARLDKTLAEADLSREKLVALKEKKSGAWRAGVVHVNQGLAQAALMKKNVSRAMGLAPNSWVGSGIQAMLSKLPGSDQKSLENIVATLKSNEGLGKLQEMKASSPTGGSGLGAVSEKELAFLTDNIAVLDPTDPRFKEQLTDILTHWQVFEDALKADALYLKTKTPEEIKKERAEREADQAKGADKKPTGAGTASDPIVLTPRKKG